MSARPPRRPPRPQDRRATQGRRQAPRSRRSRNPPLRPTDWGHSVLAITLTLIALGSWAWAAQGGGSSDTPGGIPEEVAKDAEAQLGDPEEDGPLRSFSLAAAGDVLIHSPVSARAAANASSGYDFAPMFEHVAPLINEVDLGICHMETPVSRDNSDISSYPVFNAPREIVDALTGAGFDLCSTASNHSYDKGATGVRTTLAMLRKGGLLTEGTASNEREAERPELLTVNGVELGHLSYTYGLNGFVLPEDEEYLVDVLNIKEILRDAARAKDLGAEFVIVSLQWGQEFQTEVTPGQMSGARRLLRSENVDLIIGHHTHVPQAIKKFGNEYAIFGLGNMISSQRPGATATCCLPETQDGLLVRVDIQETETGWDSSVTYWPTWVQPATFEILPVAMALDDPSYASDHEALRASWDRTTQTVSSLGGRKAGVRPSATPAG